MGSAVAESNSANGVSGNGRKTVALWSRLTSNLFRVHTPCPGCKARVQFTGERPSSPSEVMIERIAGGRESVPLHWLEERLSEALYHAEVRQGAWALDVGIWGPGAFRSEAQRTLEGLRPGYARLSRSSSTTG